MSPVAAFVSFRFGPTDGVSVVSRTWMRALEQMGYAVTTVSGEDGSDTVIDGLGLTPSGRDIEAITGDLESSLCDVDLVVVENLLTIPLNLDASRAARTALRGRHVIVHHHDPPWHRERFAHITELPVDSPGWQHVSINHVLQTELLERGIHSTLIYNGFTQPSPHELASRKTIRDVVRAELDVGSDEFLVAHPVRAIARKNIPAAIHLCEALDATYWLLGPAEEDYGSTLDQLLEHARCRVVHAPRASISEIYAACDHVTFPSTWEGFGNPPIEASLYHRPVDIGTYPVGAELRALGFDWLDSADPTSVRALHRVGSEERLMSMLDRNEAIAREHFSFERMYVALEDLLARAGWLP